MRSFKYQYCINIDERGEFRADLREFDTDNTVYEIEGFWIFEDGFMKHKTDLDSLKTYLEYLEVIPANSEIVLGN